MIELGSIPPLRGPRPPGAAAVSRHAPRHDPAAGAGEVSRRSILGTLISSGTALGFMALGVFPAAKRAYADGYDIKPLPCPGYAGTHDCSPGCGPSQVDRTVCTSAGWHKVGSANPWYWTLEPDDCADNPAGDDWDGWLWAYGDTCGGCVAVEYRCHDGRTYYCAEQCGSWITICRKTTRCYRN